jgi:hypothetical protein
VKGDIQDNRECAVQQETLDLMEHKDQPVHKVKPANKVLLDNKDLPVHKDQLDNKHHNDINL